MAVHSRGIALAPRTFVLDDLAANRLVAPFADGLLQTPAAYHVLTRRGGVPEEARMFVNWLIAEAACPEGPVDDL